MKKFEEGICPVCGEHVEYEYSFIEDDQVGQEWTCPKCDAQGTEWYDLVYSTTTVNGQNI